MRAAPATLGVATNCHHNGGMDDWPRLGQHVTARRVELGYRRREDLIAAIDGISLRTLGSIETGSQTGYHRNTIATLETALHWAPGSIQTILNGGNPTPATTAQVNATLPALTANASAAVSASDEAIIRVMNSPDLDDQAKAKIMRLLIAEQERFARERVTRADELIQAFRND